MWKCGNEFVGYLPYYERFIHEHSKRVLRSCFYIIIAWLWNPFGLTHGTYSVVLGIILVYTFPFGAAM
jgi:hypothetical protein